MSPRIVVTGGQRWRHKPSDQVRTVLAVLTYKQRTGLEPGTFELAYGMTHIAAMGMDRQDASDMILVDGEPAYPSEWEFVAPL